MKRFILSTTILIAVLMLLIFGARFAGTQNTNPAEILRKDSLAKSMSPFSKEILLGEAILVLGDPLYADVCLARAFDSHNYGYDYSPLTLIAFKNGAWLTAQSRQTSSWWSISPDMTVISMSYAFPINIRSPWQGFRTKPDIPRTCGIK